MAAFPRDIEPKTSSPFVMPGALLSRSQQGKIQRRSTTQIGRMWTETYAPFKGSSVFGRKFIAAINNFWRNGLSFDIEHYLYLTPNGGGTGTARINGVSLTGSSIATDGWGGSNPVLKAGDIITIAGITNSFDIVSDAPNLVTGAVSLSINPPIFAGGSPADNAIITYAAPRFQAIIALAPNIPEAMTSHYVSGLQLTFAELV